VENPSVSLVVICRDEPFLDRTLTLLRPQCEAIGAECIVVDSSSGRLQPIADRHSWVRWIDHAVTPGQRTIPHQRNVGCLAARGSVIAFCDAGGEPDKDWLNAITAPFSPVRMTRRRVPFVRWMRALT
jgi:glycosyltransferase involved in cell wall biosynthesis